MKKAPTSSNALDELFDVDITNLKPGDRLVKINGTYKNVQKDKNRKEINPETV